eukprot:CAMPEP_0113950214 /NCGR_PEP_ID=MMETSP1339-20121228/79854_1 /TAXON_ID=94617 /ORGANISM="Fibrocapsa japonica" /LENGTH=128 /DNA_ID=CAMNT_0000957989 /DNA_START=28 /DNA_END=410 /DNA_ORIENTATION=- /assembly_acc=CAM_ASM_000762
MKLKMNGRQYTIERNHAEMLKLISQLKNLGYYVPNELEEVDCAQILRSVSYNSSSSVCGLRRLMHHSVSKGASPVTFSEGQNPTIDFVRSCVERCLLSVLSRNEGIHHQNNVQRFFWEPTSPPGSLQT